MHKLPRQESESLKMVIPQTFIMSGLWMGDLRAVENIDFLDKFDIRTIINVSDKIDPQMDDTDVHDYALKDHDLMENEVAKYTEKVIEIVDVLDSARKANNVVLVHDGIECVNRAPLIIAYYLTKKMGYKPQDAIALVKAKNEERDKADRILVTVNAETKEQEKRCQIVKTFTNRSFYKMILTAGGQKK